MKMKFLVLNKTQVMNIHPSIPYIVISITCPNQKDIPINKYDECKGILRLSFDDVDSEVIDTIKFDSNMADLVRNFVTTHMFNIELIICQCCAGISRSAGMAAALSKVINGEDVDFFKNSFFIPNMLVYSKVLNSFKNME